jgi:copper(I)-binding protein
MSYGSAIFQVKDKCYFNYSKTAKNLNVDITSYYVKEMKQTPILGAFMEISNHSDGNIKLLSANTKGYKRLELHKTVFQGGMMKMIKQDLTF